MTAPVWVQVLPNARKFAAVTRAVTNTTNLGTEVHDIQGYHHISAFWVHVTAISGVLASVVVTIQTSQDGLTWVDTDSSAAIVVAGGAIDVKITPTLGLHRYIRVKDVVDNTTTPSITYSVWYGFTKPTGALPTVE